MIGTRVADRYDIEEQIGIGGMGIVYRALDTRLMRRVALKVIAPHLMQQETARTQFLREAQALAGLMHPNIVTVFDLCDDERTQTVFIVMELLRGHSLRHAMTGPARPLFSQLALSLCRALEAAHGQGFLHRDIKPENVFVCEDGTIKLMDFGLARLLTANSRSQASLLAGTLAYMAPEQLKGEKVDFRADLYSLGILLYEFLSGVTPFQGDNPGAILLKHLTEAAPPLHTHVPEIAPELEAVIQRLLEKDPNARFESAKALRETLERPATDGAPLLAQRADTTAPHVPQIAPASPTAVGAPSDETPTPLLPAPAAVPTQVKSASSIFRAENGKVKPAFLVGGSLACFGAAALLFLGPIHRYMEPSRGRGGDRATKEKSAPAVALAQQTPATPSPGQAPVATTTQQPANTALDELIKQQEQTRAEVERLEKLVAASDDKRKAAETRAANAEAAARQSQARKERSSLSQDSIVNLPGMNKFPMIPTLRTPPSSKQSVSLPPGLPEAIAELATLRPHDPFEFRTRPLEHPKNGSLQVQVHSAKPCYLYFYTLDDAKKQAVFQPTGDRHLPGSALPNVFTGIDLRPTDLSPSPGPVKLLMLASARPLFGLPPSFSLPDTPKHPPHDAPTDGRFTLLHDYRDLIVTTLQANHVQLEGRTVQQDDLIVRFLRDRPDRTGTPPFASSPNLRAVRRNRPGPNGTRTP